MTGNSLCNIGNFNLRLLTDRLWHMCYNNFFIKSKKSLALQKKFFLDSLWKVLRQKGFSKKKIIIQNKQSDEPQKTDPVKVYARESERNEDDSKSQYNVISSWRKNMNEKYEIIVYQNSNHSRMYSSNCIFLTFFLIINRIF